MLVFYVFQFWDPAARQDDDEVVFLRRMDGSVSFDRYWADYQRGFGNPEGEFWLGLEALHQLTATNDYNLRVSMTAWEDHNFEEHWLIYTGIQVGPYFDSYRLTLSGFDFPASSTGDTILVNDPGNNINGSEFTTRFRENDHCAYNQRGGWWYNDYCGGLARPTGFYLTDDHTTNHDGVLWWVYQEELAYSWKALDLTLIKVTSDK